MRAPVGVLVADRSPLFRAALGVVLGEHAATTVLSSTGSGQEAVAAAHRHLPVVALLDEVLPDMTGVEVCAWLRDSGLDTRCLLLVDRPEPQDLVAALESGAVGCVDRQGSLAGLVEAVQAAADDEVSIPRPLLGPLLQELIVRRRRQDEYRRRWAQLTPREREVLAMLVDGLTGDDIAARLVVSPLTARNHIQRVLARLGVHSRLEARAVAVEHDLLRETWA